MSTMIAVKSLHPTRKAVSGILHEKKAVDFVYVDSLRHVEAIMDTAKIAFVKETSGSTKSIKFYPVVKETVAEQYELAVAGEDFTVDEDPYFGCIRFTSFLSPVDLTDEDNVEYAKLLKDVKIEANYFFAKLIYVEDPALIDIDAVDKAGYYFAFNYDNTNIAAVANATYSNAKLWVVDNTPIITNLTNGINLIYMGDTNEEVYSRRLAVAATLTIKESAKAETVNEDVVVFFENKFTPIVINTDIGANPVAPVEEEEDDEEEEK